MGMIEIILTVCAISNPANCEEKYLQFAWDGSLRQCVMAAQPYIAEWIGRHPEWGATKWRCDYPGHEKRRSCYPPPGPPIVLGRSGRNPHTTANYPPVWV